MVVVQQGNTHISCNLTDLLNVCDHLAKLIGIGAMLGHQIRNYNKRATDISISLNGSLGICNQIHVRNVCRQGDQAQILAHFADFCGLMSVGACQLDAVIAHRLDLFQSAVQICLCFFSQGVNLNCNRKLLHFLFLLFGYREIYKRAFYPLYYYYKIIVAMLQVNDGYLSDKYCFLHPSNMEISCESAQISKKVHFSSSKISKKTDSDLLICEI